MIKHLRLYFVMLRYRVALMLLIFMFIGVAMHNNFSTFSYKYLLASLSLLSGYVAATTVNDVADRRIDKINHPGNKGRPLVTGEASSKELYELNVAAALLSLLLAFLVNVTALLVAVGSLVICYIYSMSPFKLSHRTHWAHLILTIAYVAVPYGMGVVASGSSFGLSDALMVAPLMLLFFGRILMKDFRDRAGDSKYHKPTFLLVYGKNATCIIGTLFVIIGNILLFFALRQENFWVLLFLQAYFLSIYLMGFRLWRAESYNLEQESIGIGAKMGNGLLLSLLALLMLRNQPVSSLILVEGLIAIGFLASFILLLRNPEYAAGGYKG
ncbi:UbiA prenyltransferase family protein [Candidatus Woesearchaeota archaeon]|nr:UbiA prenyltransferase family protein [Candidatus Woesearchaeota archaeon]